MVVEWFSILGVVVLHESIHEIKLRRAINTHKWMQSKK